jgi:hypothetical protein
LEGEGKGLNWELCRSWVVVVVGGGGVNFDREMIILLIFKITILEFLTPFSKQLYRICNLKAA